MQAEQERLGSFFNSANGRDALLDDGLSVEQRISNLNTILTDTRATSSLLDDYNGNVAIMQSHLAMDSIQDFPTGEISPDAQMPPINPALEA